MDFAKKQPTIVKECALPSKGLLYGDALPSGMVTMSPFTTADEKLMAGGSEDRTQLIDTLISRRLMTEAVAYDDFLLSDKIFMLFFLRGISYGFEFSFSRKCSSCKNHFSKTCKFPEDFQVRELTEDDREPYEVKLPVSGDVLTLRHLRIRDEKELSKHMRRNAGKVDTAEGDPTYILRLSRHITTINGEEILPHQGLLYCENMYSQDSLAIQHTIEEHDCGIDLMMDHTCPICDNSVQELIPFNADFFRPKSPRLRKFI